MNSSFVGCRESANLARRSQIAQLNGPVGDSRDRVLDSNDLERERMAIVDEHTWNPPLAYPAKPVSPKDRVGYSPEIEGGRLDVRDVIEPIYQEASDALGREFKYPTND